MQINGRMDEKMAVFVGYILSKNPALLALTFLGFGVVQ